MRLKNSVLLTALLFSCAGCWSVKKPTVWVDEEASFAGYSVVQFHDVTDDTGLGLQPGIMNYLTRKIRERFEKKGQAVVFREEASPYLARGLQYRNTLILRVSITEFEESGGTLERMFAATGRAQCAVRTRVLDGQTGNLIAEVVSIQQEDGYSLLDKCAISTADAIVKMLKQ